MSDEARESGRSKGGACSGARSVGSTRNGRSPKGKAKPYCITRIEVLEAYFKVKSNKGAAGIDDETIEDFERNLKRNLYKVWNRMSSDSYFPPPVRTVMIPKAKGGLELHSEKTKLVYCKDSNRQENHPHEKFDFLGFTFRPRKATTRRGGHFSSFSPAMSNDAAEKIRSEIRRWKLHLRTAQSIADLAQEINPKLRGWFNYYGRFHPSELRPIERHVGQSLVRWACRKYKTLRHHRTRAWEWLLRVIARQPDLLALWENQRCAASTMGAV